ncbi:MAG TPA: sugar isomerase domain-containing protein [Natronosporangium sp.]
MNGGGRVLGIDLGGTTIAWALLLGDQVVDRGRIDTPPDQTSIVAALTGIAAAHPAAAIGVGVPGHADRATGVIRFIPNLPGEWAGFPLGETLAGATGVPVWVLNDARAFCLAELTLGAAAGETDALFLTLGTGVGGGLVSGGKVLVGPDDRLGEIGHLTYRRGGPRCGCGNTGCLEVYASGPAIAAAAGRRTAAEVVAAAEAGDERALAAIEAAGRAIGETAASVAALVPARVLVIGGGVAAALPVLRPHIEAALAQRADFIGEIEVRRAALGEDAGAIGAALAAGPPVAAPPVTPSRGTTLAAPVAGSRPTSPAPSASIVELSTDPPNNSMIDAGKGAWLRRAGEVLAAIANRQTDAIEAASRLCAKSIAAGGVVHTFGTGHSRIPVEELFPRYGSYPGFHPIVELSMTYHTQVVGANGQRQAMFIERIEGLAEQILANFELREIDTMMVFSASGRNAVPIEIAMAAKKAGLPVIAVTSLAETHAGPPRHRTGTRLADHADVVIDLCTPVGDALCDVDGLAGPVGPGSSLAAIAIVNEIKVRVAAALAAQGITLPVLTSAALVGPEESQRLFDAAYAEHARRAAEVLRKEPA